MIIIDQRGKIATFNSDVAGTFDRVSSEILVAKLRSHGIHERILGLIVPWLQNQTARVVAGGAKSEEYILTNQVFQGTVIGTILWDVHFEDVHVPVRNVGYKDFFVR